MLITGLASLSKSEQWPEVTARLKRLVEETDGLSDGWLSHAKGLLQQCKVPALSQDVKTWPRMHGQSLCEEAALS